MPGMDTGDERVLALDSMHQALLLEKLEGAVNDRRSDILFDFIHRLQHLVGAHRLMRAQQNLEDLQTARGQAHRSLGAELMRTLQQVLLTISMIMAGEGQNVIFFRFVHSVILLHYILHHTRK